MVLKCDTHPWDSLPYEYSRVGYEPIGKSERSMWYADTMLNRIDQLTSQDLGNMSQADFDAMPFGIIQLDRNGIVKTYNVWEGNLARRDPRDVVGKNFFTEIAPCTNVAEFRGKLDELIDTPRKGHIFDYNFVFPWGTRKVRVRFVVESPNERWVLVTNVG